MIGTLHTSRYVPYANPKALWDPFASDTFTEEYLGCSIVVELVSPEFVKAHVLSPSGKPIGEMSTASTVEGVLAACKMLIEQSMEGDA
jgi:hypothetical protein